MTNWKPLRTASLDALREARLQCHYAVQTVSALGRAMLEERPGDSHTSMVWLPGWEALGGMPTPGQRSTQAALRPADLKLLLLDAPSGVELFSYGLPGRTLDQAYNWFAGALEARFQQPLPQRPGPPAYGLPPHRLAEGAPFAMADPEAFAELAGWFGNAAMAIRQAVAGEAGAGPIRCWPRHFDIAALIGLGHGVGTDEPRSIGVGMSPGGEPYPEPYWYVAPWPYPDEMSGAPGLASGGFWHREGFTAAVLPASAMPADNQQGGVLSFLSSGIAACRRLLT